MIIQHRGHGFGLSVGGLSGGRAELLVKAGFKRTPTKSQIHPYQHPVYEWYSGQAFMLTPWRPGFDSRRRELFTKFACLSNVPESLGCSYLWENQQNHTSSEGYYIAIEMRFSPAGSYHRGEFIEPKRTLWAPQNVLVQKLSFQRVTENVMKSLRFFT